MLRLPGISYQKAFFYPKAEWFCLFVTVPPDTETSRRRRTLVNYSEEGDLDDSNICEYDYAK